MNETVAEPVYVLVYFV
jgi:hypothetical protein